MLGNKSTLVKNGVGITLYKNYFATLMLVNTQALSPSNFGNLSLMCSILQPGHSLLSVNEFCSLSVPIVSQSMVPFEVILLVGVFSGGGT